MCVCSGGSKERYVCTENKKEGDREEEKGGGRDREKGPKKQKKPQSDISSNLNPKLLSIRKTHTELFCQSSRWTIPRS